MGALPCRAVARCSTASPTRVRSPSRRGPAARRGRWTWTLSRRSLSWGEENARLNGQSPPPADRLAGDVFDWLRRLGRKSESFDAVVLDPPGFARGKAGTFSASRDWPELVAQTAPLVAPGGWLLAACNVAALPARRFEAALADGVRRAGRTAEEVARPDASPVDFPVPPWGGTARSRSGSCGSGC